MKRLNQERQEELTPDRMNFAIEEIQRRGFTVQNDGIKLWFIFKGERVIFFPYTGWATGKTIKDGRGIHNLLKQLA